MKLSKKTNTRKNQFFLDLTSHFHHHKDIFARLSFKIKSGSWFRLRRREIMNKLSTKTDQYENNGEPLFRAFEAFLLLSLVLGFPWFFSRQEERKKERWQQVQKSLIGCLATMTMTIWRCWRGSRTRTRRSRS